MCNSKIDGGMGFRDMECFKRALVAKQGWRILSNLSNLDSLLACVLKGKYYPHSSFLQAAQGRKVLWDDKAFFGEEKFSNMALDGM